MSEQSFRRGDFVVFKDDPFVVYQITGSQFDAEGSDVIWTYNVIYIGGEGWSPPQRNAFHDEIAIAAPMLVIAAAAQG